MPFIETADKTSLYVNDWGSGHANGHANGRTVVLVHGWPLNADMWEYQSVFLAEHGCRVITYDRRGFGRSGQPWTGYDYDTLADDLKTVLDHFDVRDITLAGFSMGGGEVARYMRRHSGARVAKTVLVSAVTPYLLQTDDNPDGVDRSVFDQMTEGLRSDRPHFLATFGKAFLGAGLLNFSVTQEIQQWTLGMAMMASPRATLECVNAFAATDFRRDLEAFRIPSLVIHGDADETVPIEKSATRAVQLIEGAELKVYDGAPHALYFTEKDRLNRDLLDFVTR